ncbi:MAG: HEPN domain-containing protein [Bacteroidetes bacterium]|nr:MAG: HEPN domain-containing protein [Bacteroidota bacterium]
MECRYKQIILFCILYCSCTITVQNLSPRTHKGTRILFHQLFLSTNLIPKEFGDLYTMIFEARQEGDYVDFAEQNEESVSFFISNVRLFNDKIKNLIINEFLS